MLGFGGGVDLQGFLRAQRLFNIRQERLARHGRDGTDACEAFLDQVCVLLHAGFQYAQVRLRFQRLDCRVVRRHREAFEATQAAGSADILDRVNLFLIQECLELRGSLSRRDAATSWIGRTGGLGSAVGGTRMSGRSVVPWAISSAA